MSLSVRVLSVIEAEKALETAPAEREVGNAELLVPVFEVELVEELLLAEELLLVEEVPVWFAILYEAKLDL